MPKNPVCESQLCYWSFGTSTAAFVPCSENGTDQWSGGWAWSSMALPGAGKVYEVMSAVTEQLKGIVNKLG